MTKAFKSLDLNEQKYEDIVLKLRFILMSFNFYGNYRKLVEESDKIRCE